MSAPVASGGPAAALHNRARNAAVRDLIDLHRAEFDLLHAAHLDELREAAGWVDNRPAANRARTQGAA